MNLGFWAPVSRLPGMDGLKNLKKGGTAGLYGFTDAAKPLAAAASQRQALYITANELRAVKVFDDLSLCAKNVWLLPSRDTQLRETAARSREQAARRLAALNAAEDGIIVASIDAALTLLAPPAVFKKASLRLYKRLNISPGEVIKKLIAAGYERVLAVEGLGQAALRGDILDIVPADGSGAVRVDFFGDEIWDIKQLDIETQLSSGEIDGVAIPPATEAVATNEGMERLMGALQKEGEYAQAKSKMRIETQLDSLRKASAFDGIDNYIAAMYGEAAWVADYMKDPVVFIDDPAGIKERAEAFLMSFAEKLSVLLEKGEASALMAGIYMQWGDFELRLSRLPVMAAYGIDSRAEWLREDIAIKTDAKELRVSTIDELADKIKKYSADKWSVIIAAGTDGRAQKMAGDLLALGAPAAYVKSADREPEKGETLVCPGFLSGGAEFPKQRFAIFGGGEAKKKSAGRQRRPDIFIDIKPGDYVVHEKHGVGRYLGLIKMKAGGNTRDYMNIEYAGADKLYLPTDQMDRIQKYSAAGDVTPRLSRMGGVEWEKTKKRVRDSVKQAAGDLVALYARRQSLEGFAFPPDTPWQREFEDSFEYEDSPDQKQSLEEIKRDMESPKIMDRLLCGDVGYGKTEVALRAAFKCVTAGKQAAIMAPTTILAQQHFTTVCERMGGYPIKVDVLSRFKTAAEQRAILKRLKSGELDIVIGTHRLLGKDVLFNDLGLLVIDEEQRFGVAHKEAIKELKRRVDVLTLSATPIPRTLYMSLSGIRDMSVINTPPEERRPIATYVMEYNDAMAREAIIEEMERGGQVYFVYNTVRDMDVFAFKLKRLVPEARIASAHGQMDEKALEAVMMKFYAGEYDVLLCSTIIESGLDIPAVNTIIVYDADRLGLAQLYQLRGRVGRSSRLGYAYFTFREGGRIGETAQKRLQAIREFTELGSGFKIAMRDLEIRGAGNILGAEQYGHMTEVGYDMYCRLVDEEVKRIKGEQVDEEEIKTVVETRMDAHIPAEYAGDAARVEIYKRLAQAREEDQIIEIEKELKDRFGKPPKAVSNLVGTALLRVWAQKAGVESVAMSEGAASLKVAQGMAYEPQRLMELIASFPVKTMFTNDAIVIRKKGMAPALMMRHALDMARALAEIRTA
ncbi:MAG: transcription-repair coupling factor [Christensenellales bacterium]|jgi:transcription-repair coupling factor (superfamily II helicase)